MENPEGATRMSHGSTPRFTAAEALEQLRAGGEANVRFTMRQIMATPEAQDRAAEGVLQLVGAVADIATGSVRFLES
jgi:carbonic anhydrase